MNGGHVSNRIRINKIVMMETGTYNPYYQRPWESHFSQNVVDDICEKVADMDRHGVPKLEPELFSGLADNFIHPATNPQGVVTLPNGWDERRIRFLMEVEIYEGLASGTIFYFQGYTDHLGVTSNGNIDPEMVFIINSFIKVNRMNINTQFGVQVKDVVAESAQIINGMVYNDINNTSPFKMRPFDVFSGIRSNYITQAYEDDLNTNMYDTTVILSSHETINNSRSNNIPSRYLANIIDSFRHSSMELDSFGGDNSPYERSSTRCRPPNPSSNEFIRCLSNITGRNNASIFRYKDLIDIDSNTPRNTNFIVLSPIARTKLVHTGDSEDWGSRNNETVMASLLLNSVSALMVENFLLRVNIRATNYDGEIKAIITDYDSFTSVDISPYIGRFIDSLTRQVLNDMTYGNQISFMLDMTIDSLGNTSIELSLNGGPSVLYNAASFCDNLLTPIIGNDKGTYYNLTNDIEHLLHSIKDTSMYETSQSIQKIDSSNTSRFTI